MIRGIIYKVGVKIRNPSILKIQKSLNETEFSSREALNELQELRFNELLKFCYLHSDYYKEVFDRVGIDPFENTVKVSEIDKFPLLTKRNLIEENSRIQTIDSFKFKKLFFSETSGSTGQALTFYKDEVWDSYNRASINRGLSWYNVKPSDRNGYFWGFSFDFFKKLKTNFLDSLLNRFRLFSYTDAQMEIFLKKCKNATYLEGYSSMIYEVAKLANKKGVVFNNIKMIKGTSEKIYPHYHTETMKAFGQRITSEYGAAESGIIAFECPRGNMHINEETCIVEVIDNKAVITNLVARSFPTIRYELGDYIKVSNDKCPCGRNHKVISEITGRIGKNIIGFNGNKYPSLTLYYVFKNMALNENINMSYRCLQREVGFLEVYLEGDIKDEEIEILNREFYFYFSDTVICNYNLVDSIHQKDKKLKDFESEIC